MKTFKVTIGYVQEADSYETEIEIAAENEYEAEKEALAQFKLETAYSFINEIDSQEVASGK